MEFKARKKLPSLSETEVFLVEYRDGKTRLYTSLGSARAEATRASGLYKEGPPAHVYIGEVEWIEDEDYDYDKAKERREAKRKKYEEQSRRWREQLRSKSETCD
jgi:hypothetical protein